MQTKIEPLWSFLQFYRNSGVDVRVFPSQSKTRFVLRIVDPDDEKTGLTYIASFSKTKLAEEAKCTFVNDKPTAEAVRKSEALDAMLQDAKAAARYVAVHCVVDQESVDSFGFDPNELGKTFVVVSVSGTAESISGVEVREETSASTATSASGRGRRVR